jgi:hypothetical protein
VNSVVHFFADGGPFMWLILLLSMLAGVVVVALGVLAAMDKRVPVAAWLVLPAGVLILGSVGTLSGLYNAGRAVEVASPDVRQVMAAAGISISMYTDAFARLSAWLICGFSVAALGIGALVAGHNAGRFDWLGAAATVAASWIAGLLYLGTTFQDQTAAIALPALMLFVGSFGVAAAGLPRPEDPERSIRARGRHIAASALALLGVLAASGLVEVSTTVTGFKALAVAAPEQKEVFLTRILQLADQAALYGWIAAAGAAVGLGVALVRVREGTDRFAQVSVVVSILLLVAVFGGWMASDARADALWDSMAEQDILRPEADLEEMPPRFRPIEPAQPR